MSSSNYYIKRELAASILLALIFLGLAVLIQVDQIIKYKKEVRQLEKLEIILSEGSCYQLVIEPNRKVGLIKK